MSDCRCHVSDEMSFFVGLLPWCAVAIVVLSWLLWAPSKAESKWWNGPLFWLANRHGRSIANAARTVGGRFSDLRDRKLSHQLGDDDESDDLYTQPANRFSGSWPAAASFGVADRPVERTDLLPGSAANPIPVGPVPDGAGQPGH
jgi:hypothetical protein